MITNSFVSRICIGFVFTIFMVTCGDTDGDVNFTSPQPNASATSPDTECTDCDPCDTLDCRPGWECAVDTSDRARCVCPEGTTAVQSECVSLRPCGDGVCAVGRCVEQSGSPGTPPSTFCVCRGHTIGEACDQCLSGLTFSQGACWRASTDPGCDCSPSRPLCLTSPNGTQFCSIDIDGP